MNYITKSDIWVKGLVSIGISEGQQNLIFGLVNQTLVAMTIIKIAFLLQFVSSQTVAFSKHREYSLPENVLF